MRSFEKNVAFFPGDRVALPNCGSQGRSLCKLHEPQTLTKRCQVANQIESVGSWIRSASTRKVVAFFVQELDN